MSIRLTFRDGVFEPLDDAMDAKAGVIYTAFSDEELRDFVETLGWLQAGEQTTGGCCGLSIKRGHITRTVRETDLLGP